MLQPINLQRYIIVLFIVVVVVGFVLFNPFNLYFLNDDFIHIPLSAQGVLFQRNSFRPLGDLSLRLDYLLYNKNAVGYHFTNLILHVVDAVFVFILTNALLSKYAQRNYYQSAATAILFFVYAFHSESVFWIIGRSASLGALFGLPAIIFYIKRNENFRYFILSCLSFCVALFAYESVWIFPLIALCFSFIDSKKTKDYKKEITFIFIVSLIFVAALLYRKFRLGEVAGNYEAGEFFHFNFINIAGNFIKLFVRCFIPPVHNKALFTCLSLAVFVLFLTAIIKPLSRYGKLQFLLSLLLLISFLPYLSLGINTHTVEGERYEYLPSVFASIILVNAIFNGIKNTSVRFVTLIFLFAYHLVFLYLSGSYYSTASSITKTTFIEINKLRDKNKLLVDSLPTECNGALIFRLGFKEGVEWMKQPGTVSHIFIHSIKIDNTWQKDYGVGNYNISIRKDLPSNVTADAVFLFDEPQLKVFK